MVRNKAAKIAAPKLSNEGLRDRSHDFDAVRAYAERLVDPETQDASLSPCPVVIRGNPIKDRMVIDLADHYTAAGNGSGSAYGIISSTPDNTLQLTTITPDVPDSKPLSCNFSGTALNNDGTAWKNAEGIHNGMRQEAIPVPNTGNVSVFQIDFNQAGTYEFVFDHNQKGVSLGMNVRTQVGTSSPSNVIATRVVGGVPESVAISGIVADYIWVEVYSTGTNYLYTGTMTIYPSPGPPAATIAFTNSSRRQTMYQFDLLSDVPSLEFYRVTALGMLGTYSGSNLSNGGRLACAKVTRFYEIDESSILEAISKLPNDSYNGPLKDGFHMHWIPGTIDDLQPRGSDDQTKEPLFQYVFAIKADDRSQSFRLQLTIHMEYFSTSAVYGAMRYCPSAQGLSPMLEYLNRLPVATENSLHMIPKLLAVLASKGAQGLGWALSHPQEIERAVTLAQAALGRN